MSTMWTSRRGLASMGPKYIVGNMGTLEVRLNAPREPAPSTLRAYLVYYYRIRSVHVFLLFFSFLFHILSF
jgi:hypothetical protein